MPSPEFVSHVEERYEPWEEELFHGIYLRVVDLSITVVDMIRCWELWDLVKQTVGLKGAILEVGCWKGGTGIVIADGARRAGIESSIYLCDTFKGTVKGSEIDKGYEIDGQFSGVTKKEVEDIIDKFELENVKVLEGVFPEETGFMIEDKVFRFVHIDVDTYQSVKDCYDWIWPRLEVGGVLVYDDYGYLVVGGIKKHVNQVRYGSDRRSIYNLNEHAVIIKLS